MKSSRPNASREWTLRQGGGQDFFMRLAPGETAAVGRDLTCELTILDAGVSRHHATFQLDGDALWLEDLHSQNGTFVNTERIQRVQVQSGDIVTIGRVSLTVLERSLSSTDLDPLRTLSQQDLACLVRISRDLSSNQGKTTIFQQLLEQAEQALKADRGVVLLWEEARSQLHPVAASPHDLFQSASRMVSPAMATAVISSRRPRLLVESIVPGGASALVAPLFAGDRALGVLYLDRSPARRGFQACEIDFLNALTWVTSLPLSAFARLRESRDSNEKLESIVSERTSELARLRLKSSSSRATAHVESEWLVELEHALNDAVSSFEQDCDLDSEACRRAGTRSLRLARLAAEAVRRLTQWQPERLESIDLPRVVLELGGLDKDRRSYEIGGGADVCFHCDPEDLILVIRLLAETVFELDAESLEVTGAVDGNMGILRVSPNPSVPARTSTAGFLGASLDRLAGRMAEKLVVQRLKGDVEVAPDGSRIELRVPQPAATLGETILLPPKR